MNMADFFRRDLGRLLNEMEACSESHDLSEPSAILATDPETGTKTITGPYPSGYAAFQGMEKLRKLGGFPPGCTFEIVPCYPPKGAWA